MSRFRHVIHPAVASCMLVLVTVALANSKSETSPPRLFNGTDFTGWEGNKDFFRIENGAIIAGRLDDPIPRNEFLCTEKEYGDFELQLEVRGSQFNVNGGIQIRSKRKTGTSEVSGYQIDTGTFPAKIYRTMMSKKHAKKKGIPKRGTAIIWGALYDESRRNIVLEAPDQDLIKKAFRPDDWNDFRIRCEGPRIQSWVNGIQIIDYTETDPDIPHNGIIGLQIHSGPPVEVAYRYIMIREL